jgi:acetoin utilization deacetylase AcuC-like enzyme
VIPLIYHPGSNITAFGLERWHPFDGRKYRRIHDALPSALDALRPDLVIFNAGSDPFIDDPLAGLGLTMSDLAERDLLVVTMLREWSIPVAMVLSGGYSSESWRIHTDGIEGILTRFDGE